MSKTPFDATEPAALARQLFGPPELDYPNSSWRRRRSPKAWDAALSANWRALWDTGEIAYRDEVLGFVCRNRLPEAYSLCWEALEAVDYEGILHSLAVGYLTFLTREQRFTPRQWSALVEAVRHEKSTPTRLLALMILEQRAYKGYEALLEELARDQSPEVAFEANLKLRERGLDTAKALLEELGFFQFPEDGIDRLWWQHKRLPLTPEQDARLMNRMTRVATRVRHRFWSLPEYPSALKLHELLLRGVPVEESDVENIGRAVFHYRESRREQTIGRRIKIVEAVAWFGNDRARDWLRAIRDSETLPKTVRNAAKRELFKLEAPTRRG